MAGYDTILAFSRGRCKTYAQFLREQDIVRELIGSVKPRKRADKSDPPPNVQFNLQTLQSSRHWKRRKLLRRRYLAEKCIRTSSLSISPKAYPTASNEIRKGGFLFSFRLPRGKMVDAPKKAKAFGEKIRCKPNPKGAQASARVIPNALPRKREGTK